MTIGLPGLFNGLLGLSGLAPDERLRVVGVLSDLVAMPVS
jgi:hypothetical protein